MSKVLILTPRESDGVVLQDLLAEDGHQSEFASDVQVLSSEFAFLADVIVADFEPWTWAGQALIERGALNSASPRLVMLCARMPRSAGLPGVLFLSKPVTLEALRAALVRGGTPRIEEAA